jgi:hypothetical protein
MDELEKACWPLVPGSPHTTGPSPYSSANHQAGHAFCRCSPSAIAGDRQGSARAAGHTGSPWRGVTQHIAVPDAEQSHQDRGCSVESAPREVLVDHTQRRRNSLKRSGPIAIASGSRCSTRPNSGRRPNSRSQHPRVDWMPNCATLPCRAGSRRSAKWSPNAALAHALSDPGARSPRWSSSPEW